MASTVAKKKNNVYQNDFLDFIIDRLGGFFTSGQDVPFQLKKEAKTNGTIQVGFKN